MRMTSSVPSSRCEIVSDRIASVVAPPPALRKTWASPSWSPRILLTCNRASMQARTNSFLAGGSGRLPALNDRAYASLFFNRSSVTLTIDPPSLSSGRYWSFDLFRLGKRCQLEYSQDVTWTIRTIDEPWLLNYRSSSPATSDRKSTRL